MIRVFVDSASSIKQEEKEKYNVEIIPLRYLMGETEYEDGVDLSIDEFYNLLINQKLFPKTSLPFLDKVQERVTYYTDNGDDVIIITLSSKISGTYSALSTMFEDNKHVAVIDSLTAVGGIRIMVQEINKYRDTESMEFIVDKVKKLVPKIRVMAIPETLDYLLKGGRLSKKEWLIGSILKIKPVISLNEKGVTVCAKRIGLASSMKYIANALIEHNCDENYPIVPSYTYSDGNLKRLIELTDEKYKKQMIEFDNLDPAIACHWGPNAFGFIFVSKTEEKENEQN